MFSYREPITNGTDSASTKSNSSQESAIPNWDLFCMLLQYWSLGLVWALSAVWAQEKDIQSNLSRRWRQRLRASLQGWECNQLSMLGHVWNASTWVLSGSWDRSIVCMSVLHSEFQASLGYKVKTQSFKKYRNRRRRRKTRREKRMMKRRATRWRDSKGFPSWRITMSKSHR